MNSKKPGLLALLPKPKGVSQTKTPELSSISALPKLGPSQTLEVFCFKILNKKSRVEPY